MEIESSPQGWFNVTVGVVLGLLGTIFGIYRGKVDRLETQQWELSQKQSTFVTRAELKDIVDQERADRLQEHTENLLRMQSIEANIIRLHDRVDRALNSALSRALEKEGQ